ncbi:hypothetical protein DEDE109153_07910 [Deinococcus deserti]
MDCSLLRYELHTLKVPVLHFRAHSLHEHLETRTGRRLMQNEKKPEYNRKVARTGPSEGTRGAPASLFPFFCVRAEFEWLGP